MFKVRLTAPTAGFPVDSRASSRCVAGEVCTDTCLLPLAVSVN